MLSFRLSSWYLLFSDSFFRNESCPNCIFSSGARSVIGLESRIASFSLPQPPRSDSKGAPDGAGTSVELIASRTMSRWPVAASTVEEEAIDACFVGPDSARFYTDSAYIQISYRGVVLVDSIARQDFWPWFFWRGWERRDEVGMMEELKREKCDNFYNGFNRCWWVCFFLFLL